MRKRSIRVGGKRVGRRDWIAALTLAILLGSVAPARAADPPAVHPATRGAGIALDLIIVRPLNLGELLFGFVCFVPVALFAAPSTAEPWEMFVADPFEATFKRPLGEFDEEY